MKDRLTGFGTLRPLCVGILLAMCCLSNEGRAQFVPPQPGQVVRTVLTTQQADAAGNVLSLSREIAVLAPYQRRPEQIWTVAATAGGYYRIQLFESGNLYSLAATQPGGPLAIVPSSRDIAQFWIVESAGSGGLIFRSAAFPFHAATGGTQGPVTLLPLEWVPAQTWLQYAVDTPLPPVPVVRVASHTYRPAAPLPPVETRLRNNHDDRLIVLLTDLQRNQTQQFTIPPGKETVVELERDAGGEIVETYEVVADGRVVDQTTFVTPVPARLRYDVSVYELFLQSIAIDRTGKSPSAIEDVNYQPKSVGIFPIPPGRQWQGGALDVFTAARQARNPGAVRRLTPAKPRAPDRLKQILQDQLRNEARRGR